MKAQQYNRSLDGIRLYQALGVGEKSEELERFFESSERIHKSRVVGELRR